MRIDSLRRPSPATILAVVALSLALAGTAVAGSDGLTNKITKSKVRSIAKKQANKVLNQREGSLNVKTAGRATNVFAANVDGSGNVLGSVPAGITANRVAEGIYRVDFPRGVSGCLIFSAFGSNDAAIDPGSTGVIPATGESPNRLAVATFNSAGATANRDFYVQMTCP
jgi:hypothetical protein